MKKFVFLSIWILSIVSCEKPNGEKSPGLGSIEGWTFIGSTNENLPGLEVRLPKYSSQITDANGYFKFDNVVEGDYTVSVYQASKFLSSKEVSVTEAHVSRVWFPFEYEEPPKKDLPDFTAVDISNESDWDYWVVGKEEYFYIDAENSLPKFVFLHSFKTAKDYGITFDDKGLPSKVTTDHFVFLFDNFNENKVDLGIVSPSGEIQIVREIKTDFVWPTSSKSRADVIRWTGRILAAIPCVTSGAAALVTGGGAIPLALWTCGNYLLSMADNFFDDANVENGFTKFVEDYKLVKTNYECVTNPDPASCIISLASKGFESYADYIEEMDGRADVLRIAEASLYAGYGDIQVTLTWDNISDLDLHVIDPFGEEIYWDHKNSVSGGELDYDHIDGYGPENIYWPKSKAPNGTYQVFVHDFVWADKPSSANYIILVNAFGRTKQFAGSVNLDETIHIADFNQNSISSAKSFVKASKITIKPKVR